MAPISVFVCCTESLSVLCVCVCFSSLSKKRDKVYLTRKLHTHTYKDEMEQRALAFSLCLAEREVSFVCARVAVTPEGGERLARGARSSDSIVIVVVVVVVVVVARADHEQVDARGTKVARCKQSSRRALFALSLRSRAQ